MPSQIDTIRQQQAKRLELIREHTGMIQSDFAKYLDLEPGSYSDIKRCKNGISKSVQTKLEKKLNVNIEWLITGNGLMILEKNEAEAVNTQYETIASFSNQPNEGTNAYIDKLFKIIERRDDQIEKLLQSLKERDQEDKNNMNKIFSMIESIKPNN
jgi:transcriptional regulator with XRE-family HTH domain